MDTAKVREAAHAVNARAGLYDVENVIRREQAGLTVARAWLSENPDDGNEPVTAEWLKAVGFLNEDADEPTFWTVTFNDLNPAFTIDVDPASTTHAGFIGEAEDYISWPHDIVCRQQVRDICRALGVQLKEPE